MAKPKRAVVIRKLSVGVLWVYCEHHAEQAAEVGAIEGISAVTIWGDMLWVWVDPRYDLDEVAAEVEVMLTPVEIPEAFLQESKLT